MWLKLFGSAVVLVGILLVFDAERIINKFFVNMKEQDNAIVGLKFLGTIVIICGAIYIM